MVHWLRGEAGSGALLELVHGLLQPAQRQATPFRVEAEKPIPLASTEGCEAQRKATRASRPF